MGGHFLLGVITILRMTLRMILPATLIVLISVYLVSADDRVVDRKVEISAGARNFMKELNRYQLASHGSSYDRKHHGGKGHHGGHHGHGGINPIPIAGAVLFGVAGLGAAAAGTAALAVSSISSLFTNEVTVTD